MPDPLISDSTARFLASEWHGGQASPLYALSSSGTPVAGLAAEVRSCLRDVERDAATTNDPLGTQHRMNDLTALLAYAEAHEPEGDDQ